MKLSLLCPTVFLLAIVTCACSRTENPPTTPLKPPTVETQKTTTTTTIKE